MSSRKFYIYTNIKDAFDQEHSTNIKDTLD